MIITALSMMPNPTNGMALFAKTSPEELNVKRSNVSYYIRYVNTAFIAVHVLHSLYRFE